MYATQHYIQKLVSDCCNADKRNSNDSVSRLARLISIDKLTQYYIKLEDLGVKSTQR